MKQWLLTDSTKDLSVNKLVEEPKNIAHLIKALTVAENFAGKKRLTFDLRYANKHIHT